MLDSLALSPLRRKELELATATYASHVHEAGNYLGLRGITEDAALRFRLGVVRDPFPDHERFEGMLCLPYITRAGVVALKFRALDPERKPKYDAPAGQTARLYNVEALHSKGDVVAVCEGEIDALVCSTAVGIPAVGVPGASHWADHWSRAFADYEEVLVIADNDVKPDGKNPGLDHAHRVVRRIPNARLIKPPPGNDLNSWYLSEGREAVRNACGL